MTSSYIWLCVTFMYTLPSITISTQEVQTKSTDSARLLKSLDQARYDIDTMVRTINSIDDDLASKQKRTCSVGLNSHFCSLADLDGKMRSREWLNSIYSPGKKRSMAGTERPQDEEDDDVSRELKELLHKRINLAKLRSLLGDADQDIIEQRKRTCAVEVGGTCRTEWAASIADQYYYLMGPHSPGKRRKRRSPIKLFRRRLTLQKLFGNSQPSM